MKCLVHNVEAHFTLAQFYEKFFLLWFLFSTFQDQNLTKLVRTGEFKVGWSDLINCKHLLKKFTSSHNKALKVILSEMILLVFLIWLQVFVFNNGRWCFCCCRCCCFKGLASIAWAKSDFVEKVRRFHLLQNLNLSDFVSENVV